MKLASFVTTFATLAIASSAFAGGQPFEFTSGGPNSIPDGLPGGVTLSMGGSVPEIATIELEINGLTHMNPWDLDIFLVSPQGVWLDVLKDRGDQSAIVATDLLFRDGGSALPANPDDALDGAPYSLGAVVPEGTVRLNNVVQPGTGFQGAFVGASGGTDSWQLIIIDDTENGKGGSFDSFTLRGTFVPEPMSLSLLAMGAFAAFKRRR